MNIQKRRKLAQQALENGSWMIRADNNGESYDGFNWPEPGEWVEAPDWDPSPVCGGGLHGQADEAGGYITGSRLVFCETDGERVVVDGSKIKVPRARILLVNELPEGLKVDGDLDLRGTNIWELPEGLEVGLDLNLRGTNIQELPKGLKVGGGLHLHSTDITELPEGLSVGGRIYW